MVTDEISQIALYEVQGLHIRKERGWILEITEMFVVQLATLANLRVLRASYLDRLPLFAFYPVFFRQNLQVSDIELNWKHKAKHPLTDYHKNIF